MLLSPLQIVKYKKRVLYNDIRHIFKRANHFFLQTNRYIFKVPTKRNKRARVHFNINVYG